MESLLVVCGHKGLLQTQRQVILLVPGLLFTVLATFILRLHIAIIQKERKKAKNCSC